MASASDTTLGRMQKVDLRAVWQSEAGGFTPWLAKEDNLSLLADTIGVELELEATEKDVGPFRADILCRDTTGDHWVLIENQLESTDHKHLGQLLTYAAGLKAVTIVWVAQTFTDEHRSALDWLNDITGEGVNFFGLEIELWRIGDSPAAPKFNIVSQPNDWRNTVIVGPGKVSVAKQLQFEFWTQFREVAEARGVSFKPTKARPTHWMPIRLGKAGMYLHAVASMWNSETKDYDTNELRAGLTLKGAKAQTRYSALLPMRAEIESEIGEALKWHAASDTQRRRVYLRRDADLNDKSKWPEYHGWLADKLDAMYKAFSKRVKELDANQYQSDDESEPDE